MGDSFAAAAVLRCEQIVREWAERPDVKASPDRLVVERTCDHLAAKLYALRVGALR